MQLAEQPQYVQMLMAAQQGKLPDNEATSAGAEERSPKLSKDKTLAAFQIRVQQNLESVPKQAQLMQNTEGRDEMTMMIDMLVEQAKMDDTLYLKEGVLNEDLESSMTFYTSKNDPDIVKAMTDF